MRHKQEIVLEGSIRALSGALSLIPSLTYRQRHAGHAIGDGAEGPPREFVVHALAVNLQHIRRQGPSIDSLQRVKGKQQCYNTQPHKALVTRAVSKLWARHLVQLSWVAPEN